MKRAHYQILHDTHYRYSAPVSLAQQLAHLWPRDCTWQRCLERHLTITPQPTRRLDGVDVFGNPLTRLAFERPHDELRVIACLRVEVLAREQLLLEDSPAWEEACAALRY
ncbi:MAG: transglutaminase N-terminal domain-containing protein, partial [Pseudomonas sp.]